ncbi:MAG: DMT family transporter [Pseudomonadota bacterium]
MSETAESDAHGQTRNLLVGSAIALLTVSIWGGWIVGTRYAVKTPLQPQDIALLRFSVPALLLAPYWIRMRVVPAGVSFGTIALITAGAGLPFYLAIAFGLQMAPASHGGMLLPGTMPLFVALIGLFLLGDRFGWRRGTGFVLIAIGGAGIGGWTIISDGIEGAWRGHLLFLAGAFLWAVYTHAFRASGLRAQEAVGILSVWSLLLLGLVYMIIGDTGLFRASWVDIGTQLLLQGFVSGLIALTTYGLAVERLGASGAAAFAALVPVIVTLLGIPVLGEVPDLPTVLAAACVCTGVFLASGVVSPARPR